MRFRKILFVSDIHYAPKVFRGHDEREAWPWFLKVIAKTHPDLVLAAGDWDVGITEEDFEYVLQKVPVLTIYGNHENMQVLSKLRNPLLFNRRVLISDNEVIDFGDFTVGGINGIISNKRRKNGVPRKKREEYVETCEKHPGVTFLLIHEVPEIPELNGLIRYNANTRAVLECLRKVNADLVLGGHIHANEYTYHRGDDLTYLRVDSSQQHRAYAVIWPYERRVEIYKDFSRIDTVFY